MSSTDYELGLLDVGARENDASRASRCSIKKPATMLDTSLPRFGPLFGTDTVPISKTKDMAWSVVASADSGETKELLLTALRREEKRAREAYAENIQASSSEFRLMMIKDGCLCLELAFFILLKSKVPPAEGDKYSIFRCELTGKDIKKWIGSMFHAGNQIPLVVIKELMKAKFFQDHITQGKWDPPPSGFIRRFMYELLVFPERESSNPHTGSSWVTWGRARYLDQQQPSDLLEALRIWLLGPAPSGHDRSAAGHRNEEDLDILDLESNELDIESGSQEATALLGPIQQHQGGDQNSNNISSIGDTIRGILTSVASRNETESHTKVFPSVIELKKSGIHVSKLSSGGIRRIHFSSRWYFWAYIYMPVLPVDATSEIILRNMISYESIQESWKHNQEVTSYLRLMCDLIQTPEDVKLLMDHGIIEPGDEYAEKLPRILSRLISPQDTAVTTELRKVKRKIVEFSSPWVHYKWVLNIVTFLTFVQTFFTLFAYFRPPKQ